MIITIEERDDMGAAEIIHLLEKPTKNRWSFVGYIRNEAAISDIIAALRTSTKPRTRTLLCYILTQRSEAGFTDTQLATPALIEALHDPDPEVQDQAAEALERIGDPETGSALLERYNQEKSDSKLRRILASAMGASHYRPALPILIEALASSDDWLRYGAAWGLRHFQAQEAKEALQQALTSTLEPQAIQAIQGALLELEKAPYTRGEDIARLIALLKSAETTGREAAAQALADMCDARVLDPLLVLLHSEQHETRQYAALALAWTAEGQAAKRFVHAHRELVQGPLILALQDQESSVRAAVAQAIGDWGDAQAVEALLELVQGTDREVRRQAIEAAGYLHDERTLEPLLNVFLTDTDQQIRAFAAQGLSQWEDNRAVNALILGLQDEQAHTRRDAAEMLCWLKDERAVDALITALQDDDPEVREWSIEALWQLCTGKGDDLSSDTSEKMRKPLIQAQQDADDEVRKCAHKILEWLIM